MTPPPPGTPRRPWSAPCRPLPGWPGGPTPRRTAREFCDSRLTTRSGERPETVNTSGAVAATSAPARARTVMASIARRGADGHPVGGGRGDQLRDAGVRDHQAPADHDQVVGGVLELAHQVAGHQHRPALRGQRPQEAAHPHDALRVHAVERLVEHQHRRVAEQRGGDAEPLPHAERVPARLAPGRAQAACSMTSSTRRAPRPWEWASHSRWLRADRLGCSAAASSSEPRWLSGCRRLA